MSALEPTYVNTWYIAGIQETLVERKKREWMNEYIGLVWLYA